MSVFAELERELISFRTTSGMEKKAKKGEFLGGKVTGYESKNKELTLIPEEAKMVRYIFKSMLLKNGAIEKLHLALIFKVSRQKMEKNGLVTPLKQS